MTMKSIRAQSLRMPPQYAEPSWAGEVTGTHTLCIGTESGELVINPFLTDGDSLVIPAETREVKARSWDLKGLSEPINCVAFAGNLLGVSTRSEVAFYERDQTFEKIKPVGPVHPGGAHGILTTASGGFIAPLGLGGLLLMELRPEGSPIIETGRANGVGLDFYKLARLNPTGRSSLFACAARHDGLLRISLDPDSKHFTIFGHVFSGLDVIDVCSLNVPGWPFAVAGLARDQTVLLCRNLWDDEPIAVRYGDLIQGTPYTILNVQGHLIILTSRTLAILPDAVTRFLTNDFPRSSRTGWKIEIQAVDAYLAFERYLLLIVDGGIQVIDVAQFASGDQPRTTGTGEVYPAESWAGTPEIFDLCRSGQTYDLDLTTVP